MVLKVSNILFWIICAPKRAPSMPLMCSSSGTNLSCQKIRICTPRVGFHLQPLAWEAAVHLVHLSSSQCLHTKNSERYRERTAF